MRFSKSSVSSDLDTLLCRADPLEGLELPAADSPKALTILQRATAESAMEGEAGLLGSSPAKSCLPGNNQRLRPWFARKRCREDYATFHALRRGSPRHARRVGVAVAATTVIALVVALAVVGAVPSPLPSTSPAGASELERIATNAERQAPLSLAPGQFLHVTLRAVFAVTVYPTSGSMPAGQAGGLPVTGDIPATMQLWADGAGTVYYHDSFGTVDFPGNGDRRGWHALGLYDSTTVAQPVSGTFRALTPEGPYVPGFGALDVRRLATDPQALARVLAKASTGIPAIDSIAPSSAGGVEVATFERAALLLIGPEVGGSPALTAALYRVLAGLHEVTDLGRVSDHEGRTGRGFALAGPAGTTEIVVDPATGELLEVRGQPMFLPTVEFAVLGQYLGPGEAPRFVTSHTASTRIDWIDVSSSQVVSGLSR